VCGIVVSEIGRSLTEDGKTMTSSVPRLPTSRRLPAGPPVRYNNNWSVSFFGFFFHEYRRLVLVSEWRRRRRRRISNVRRRGSIYTYYYHVPQTATCNMVYVVYSLPSRLHSLKVKTGAWFTSNIAYVGRTIGTADDGDDRLLRYTTRVIYTDRRKIWAREWEKKTSTADVSCYSRCVFFLYLLMYKSFCDREIRWTTFYYITSELRSRCMIEVPGVT